ncbi:hypothetical protein RRF57_003007 [Xylaria bambusicola]|uniref:Uncharacterized protein n=1 Tax=Xylaria bambusicola TaxID=326684 RepID=A0AAN7Z2Z8_9PEZI
MSGAYSASESNTICRVTAVHCYYVGVLLNLHEVSLRHRNGASLTSGRLDSPVLTKLRNSVSAPDLDPPVGVFEPILVSLYLIQNRGL